MISYRSDRLDRSSDPSRASDDAGGLRWLGPGSTGLVVRDSRDASDEGGWFRRRELGAAEAFAEGDADPDASILAPYFLAGGRRITLVPVPRELRFPLGEDAAPGERHGIHAFRDSDDVGCAIVPELDDRDIDAALAFARENPWLLSILACGGFGVSPSSTSRERSKPSARRERGPSGQAESEAPTRSIEKPLEN
ncbi:MAG TPA: hypothetical protein VK116_01955, partial [Planctomycetota bacterium]|nr:hypothetical protein [Planctomycetota bacterium]